ncbi:MFS transporter [bacterium]|nr:MAG: MFS transporter [bacterium]
MPSVLSNDSGVWVNSRRVYIWAASFIAARAYQVESGVAFTDRLPSLGYPDFRRWIVGSFFSNVGGSLQLWAVFWQLDNLTHDVRSVGYVGLIRVFPLLAFGLFAGLVADTRERPKILLVTQSAMGIVSLALAGLTLAGSITPGLIYLLLGLDACARAYDGPARQSIVANLVPSHHYANAASIGGIQWRLSEVLGPVLSGLFIWSFGAQNGPGAAYVVNALSFGALLYAVLRLPPMPARNERSQGTAAVLNSIKEGIVFLRRTVVVRNAMWIDFWGTFVAGASALLPAYNRAVLHLDERYYGFLISSQGLGAMIASSFLAWRPAYENPGRIVIAMIALFGISTAGVGLSPNFWVAAFFLMGVGATDMISTVQRQTIRQLAVPDEMRGRLSSIGMIFQVSGPQLGDYEAAQLAAYTGTRASFIVGGLGAIFAAGWYWLRGPALRDYKYDTTKPS